jgi:hypothetical protein
VELVKTQQCPNCGYIVDDAYAEWEEGEHEVECDRCSSHYLVEPVYEFKGFKIQKLCAKCGESEDVCCCEDDEMNQEVCVMCGRVIDIDNEPYETGESLGEYWCIDCAIAYRLNEEISNETVQ